MIKFIDWNLIEYSEAWKKQQEIASNGFKNGLMQTEKDVMQSLALAVEKIVQLLLLCVLLH